MPPNTDTESRLLALLDRHLQSTEATIARLEGRVDALGLRFDSAIADIRRDLTADARRQFYVQLLLVIVVAAMGGANLYIQASRDGDVTVATGTAAALPTTPTAP